MQLFYAYTDSKYVVAYVICVQYDQLYASIPSKKKQNNTEAMPRPAPRPRAPGAPGGRGGRHERRRGGEGRGGRRGGGAEGGGPEGKGENRDEEKKKTTYTSEEIQVLSLEFRGV